MKLKIPKYLIAVMFLTNASSVFGACENKTSLLTIPQPKETVSCTNSIQHNLGRRNKVDKEFVNQFINTLLPRGIPARKKLADLGYFDVRYSVISEIISLVESEELIATYIDFIIDSSGSADEKRSFGLAKLYTLQAPAFLNELKTRTEKEQTIVIGSLSWGLVNNFYPHIEVRNYKRLIVGEHWELVNSIPRSATQIRIEATVLEMVNAN